MKKLIFISMMLIASSIFAQHQLTFQWDLSADDTILGNGGYHLFQSKVSGQYVEGPIATVPAGVSTITVTINALGRHYWVATAFLEDGTESDYSNEVTTVIKPKSPKLNAVQQVAEAIKGVVSTIVGAFKDQKNLRIMADGY